MLALDILGICNVLIVPWGLFVSRRVHAWHCNGVRAGEREPVFFGKKKHRARMSETHGLEDHGPKSRQKH